MNMPLSVALPFEALRTRSLEVLRKHWVKPRVVADPEPVPEARVEAVSRAALDTMLTRQFRVGPLPAPEVYAELLQRVARRVRRNKPIKVTIGYGPLKNQNAVRYSRADWAEFFALCHLVAWHNKVQAVYAPGLAVQIVFDDSTLVMANRAEPRLMESYMASIRELIDVLGFRPIFRPAYAQSRFSWVFHCGLYLVARWRVRRWERDPANREQLQRMDEFARRNVSLPPDLDPEQAERYLRRASHRYRVYWEALQLSGFSRHKRRLVAMYLDGTQHHHPQEVALHLTTLDKGQVTQPWQGEGVLLDNGHGRLEPFVLTAGRRPRYARALVDDVNVVPAAGFDRIAVVRPTDYGVPSSEY